MTRLDATYRSSRRNGHREKITALRRYHLDPRAEWRERFLVWGRSFRKARAKVRAKR